MSDRTFVGTVNDSPGAAGRGGPAQPPPRGRRGPGGGGWADRASASAAAGRGGEPASDAAAGRALSRRLAATLALAVSVFSLLAATVEGAVGPASDVSKAGRGALLPQIAVDSWPSAHVALTGQDGATFMPGGVASTAQAAKCGKQRKALKRFKRVMASKKKAFFTKQRSARKRKGFVTRQRRQLAGLQRALTRCLDKPGPTSPAPPPQPGPPAPPAPQPGPSAPDATPPTLAIDAPAEGVVLPDAHAGVRGTASDVGSGVAGVTCDGKRAELTGAAFTCDVALIEGANPIVVEARDGAGNVARVERLVKHFPSFLTGAGTAPALDAVRDLDTGEVTPPDQIEEDGGQQIVRTILEIGFAPDATTDAVNAVVASVDGRIVSMLDGVAMLVVEIPDPGSVAALNAIAARVREDATVRYAIRDFVPQAASLPQNASESLARLNSQLAVRAPAAWNARSEIPAGQRPVVVVADFFGDGPPGPDFDVEVEPSSIFHRGARDWHGYHVAGIIAADFGGAASERGQATGIFPGTTRLLGIDLTRPTKGVRGARRLENDLINAVEASAGNVIVNTSVAFGHGGSEEALAWIGKVRGTESITTVGAGLENRFLHVTGAGNIERATDSPDAVTGSSFNAARLLGNLTTAAGDAVPNLLNTLVVENVVATEGSVTCRNASSMRGGDVAGVGTDVWSLEGSGENGGAGPGKGTSMAAPQVAGLAAYAWTLAPTLASRDVARLLTTTGRQAPVMVATDPRCDQSGTPPAPVIDAYDALLSLDAAALPAPGLARVRETVLDVANGNRKFDGSDLADYASVYLPDGVAVDPATPDYDQYDLNGDGFSGGSRVERFDLDRIDSTRYAGSDYSTVERPVEGVPVRFDETRLTDLKALCFYAWSPLYGGSPDASDARHATLGVERCLRLGLDPVFPETIPRDADTPLQIHTSDLDLTTDEGTPLPQEGVRIELAATGGTVEEEAGITDEDGIFATSARINDDVSALTIEVVARAGDGGPELARATVTASAPPTPARVRVVRHIVRVGAGGAVDGNDVKGGRVFADVCAPVGGCDAASALLNGFTRDGTGVQEASATAVGGLSGDAFVRSIVEVKVSGAPVSYRAVANLTSSPDAPSSAGELEFSLGRSINPANAETVPMNGSADRSGTMPPGSWFWTLTGTQASGRAAFHAALTFSEAAEPAPGG